MKHYLMWQTIFKTITIKKNNVQYTHTWKRKWSKNFNKFTIKHSNFAHKTVSTAIMCVCVSCVCIICSSLSRSSSFEWFDSIPKISFQFNLSKIDHIRQNNVSFNFHSFFISLRLTFRYSSPMLVFLDLFLFRFDFVHTMFYFVLFFRFKLPLKVSIEFLLLVSQLLLFWFKGKGKKKYELFFCIDTKFVRNLLFTLARCDCVWCARYYVSVCLSCIFLCVFSNCGFVFVFCLFLFCFLILRLKIILGML